MGRLGEMRLPGLGNGVGGAVHRGEHTQSPGGHGFTGGSEPGAGKENLPNPVVHDTDLPIRTAIEAVRILIQDDKKEGRKDE